MPHSDHPIVTAVKAQVKDQSQPFNMAVHIKIKPVHAAAFEAAFKICIAATRKETGCIAYDLNRSSEDASRYINYERWASVPALAAHLAAEHTVKLLDTVGPLLDGSPEVKVYFFAGE
jgi:quinol monooxygenase YgiN